MNETPIYVPVVQLIIDIVCFYILFTIVGFWLFAILLVILATVIHLILLTFSLEVAQS